MHNWQPSICIGCTRDLQFRLLRGAWSATADEVEQLAADGAAGELGGVDVEVEAARRAVELLDEVGLDAARDARVGTTAAGGAGYARGDGQLDRREYRARAAFEVLS